jgi:RHS repeat-associated protein
MSSPDTRSGQGTPSGQNHNNNHPLDRYSNPATPQGDGGEQSPYFKSAAPSISLPKGGGALKGIDEKFTVNAVNGTAGLEIPLPLTPGRSGFTPALGLSYNSGSGNSPFGLGWNLGLPSIRRKTDKRLPQYNDFEDSDVFLLAGAEDLVPKLIEDGDDREPDEEISGPYLIRRYRPRIEGLWARIEHIYKHGSNASWWRVTTKENITTYYGLTPEGRIADPADAKRIFEWLPQLVVDGKGNAQEYRYKAEDDAAVPAAAHERNRLNGFAPLTNTYLKRVGYCNMQPYFGYEDRPYEPQFPLAGTDWLMETVLDYGDHSESNFTATPDQPWPCRRDAFSDYRAGFEIRTRRLCRRVLQFHRFRELNADESLSPVLVRSLELAYKGDAMPDTYLEADQILSAVQKGWVKVGTEWQSKALPPMEFEYQPLQWDSTVHTVSPEDVQGAPQGLTGPYQWTDLKDEGISGILTEQAEGWFYKENLGGGHFSPALPVAEKPSFSGLGATMQWTDLDADGRRQLASYDATAPGFFEINDDQKWESFTPFKSLAQVDWNSPYTKLLDLNGDGRVDILLTEDGPWTWYANKGKEGYVQGGRTNTGYDEERGPRLLLADAVQRVFLADMNGDGLTDLVRIGNGEVCYWPNLGWGRFGAKVTMDNAPVLDTPDGYNPLYLTLADISGTGAPDLVYLSDGSFRAWINLSGNAFSEAYEVAVLPGMEPYSKAGVLDFLGNGTGCIVWSSPLPQYASAPLRYIDLMGGRKPHLMTAYRNGMGKEVALHYKSSTQYYLADKAAGEDWATRLPFPVHCIEKIVTTDSVSETSYTQRYRYKHGYYDHEEREFRGFGRVDVTDADSAAFFLPDTTGPQPLEQAPVLTRTWYHTGAWRAEGTLLAAYAKEYYRFDGWDELVRQTHIPAGLNAQELREAHRALKGSALRQEVYAVDGNAKEGIPYTVTISSYEVVPVQSRITSPNPSSSPEGENAHAVFLLVPEQALSWSCERNPEDARLVQQMTLQVNEWGQPLATAQVAYPRRSFGGSTALPQPVQDAQAKMHITASETGYTNAVLDNPVHYRLPLPCEAVSWEITGFTVPSGLWKREELHAVLESAAELDNAGTADGSLQKRLLSHSQSFFMGDDTSTFLDFGEIEPLAIPFEQYTLAHTAAGIARDYGSRMSTAELEEGGYVELYDDGGWWLRSGSAVYELPREQFYTPTAYLDPWGNPTYVTFEEEYWMLPVVVTDALENMTEVDRYNWRVLQPEKMTDPNGNISEICYDALGLPVAMAMKGKGSEGDNLTGLSPDSTADAAAQAAFWQDRWAASSNGTVATDLLQGASWRCIYDLDSAPVKVAMIARERHVADTGTIVEGEDNPLLARITYTDGLGRVIMHKAQAADLMVDNEVLHRWVGSGRTVYNNKGKAVLQYEPYFSTTQACDTAEQAAAGGVSPRIHYDALGRVCRTDLPDGTYSEARWDAWRTESWDGADTVLTSDWYASRINNSAAPKEQEAAQKSAPHAGTPTVQHLDSLGRPFYTVQHNRTPVLGVWTDAFYHSWEELDIEGQRLAVHDARGNVPLQYRYNVINAPCWQHGTESGTNRMLLDAAGQPLYRWDAEVRRFRTEYDELRRPTVQHCDSVVLERFVYGEGVSGAAALNLKGRLWRHWDGAGMVEVESYDFKGTPLVTTRRFIAEPTGTPHWATVNAAVLESAAYSTTTVTDALGRPVSVEVPDGSLLKYGYDRGGAPYSERVENLPVTGDDLDLVTETVYDAKGQKVKEVRGNGTTTIWEYDPFSFRVSRIKTTRSAQGDTVQDLIYVYDAVGNVTYRRDDAQQTVFFNNGIAAPENCYSYDALYRLIKASGREHVGQNAPSSWNDSDRTGLPHKADETALQLYIEYYSYDEVGNPLEVRHTAGAGQWTNYWTRTFAVSATTNHMTGSTVGSTTESYGYDSRGNLISGLSHISGGMGYNEASRLMVVAKSDSTWWYQYDGGGQRVRKTGQYGGSVYKQRIYVGGWERYADSNGIVRNSLKTGAAMIETRTAGTDDANNAAVNSRLAQIVRYQYGDHLGSSSLELDADGAVISFEEYTPFGSTSFQSGRSSAEAKLKRYRYTGKERDEETGLNYHGARYYAPWLLRWMAVDPLESKYAGRTPFCYCSNNPIVYNDPDGKDGKKPNAKGSESNPIGIDEVSIVASKTTQQEAAEKASNSSVLETDRHYSSWRQLADMNYDESVYSQLEDRTDSLHSMIRQDVGFYSKPKVQSINEAVGTFVNLDYFSINIEVMPEIPGYEKNTPENLLNYIRLNINDFLDGKNFTPFMDEDAKRWQSDDYKNSIIHIDMGANSINPFSNLDDGSVIVSAKSNRYWVFTTIQIVGDWQHPVSGNRKFGIEESASGYVFYTRGADRTTGILDNNLAPTVFSKGEDLWNELMKNLVTFINTNGGKASVNAPIISRPEWSKFKRN